MSVSRAAGPSSAPLDRLHFRPDLQGLRAVAIVLVVLAHAEVALFEGGFVGVDVFFVLSGYLITGLLARELAQTRRIRFLDFYARRLKRLLPALVVVVAAAAAAGYALLSASEARSQLASAPFALTWTSNFHFAFAKIGYFDQLAARDLFLHTWSLGIEEQFYLVWPLLMLLAFHLAGAGLRGGGRPRIQILVLGLVAALSLGLSLWWSAEAPRSAFYMMPSRVWQFAVGGLIFLWLARPPGEAAERLSRSLRPPLAGRLALAAGLLLILGSALGLHGRMTYPGYWALLPTLGAALVIAAGHAPGFSRRSPLAHPTLVWLGDRSYSLYLWHWPVFTLAFSLGLGGTPAEVAALALLSVLAAMLTYRLVEYPFWKGRLSTVRPLRAVLVGCLVMATAVSSAFHLDQAREHPLGPAGAEARLRVDLPPIYRQGCDRWFQDSEVAPCVFGAPGSDRTVVLLGDSVGAQWFSMVPGIFAAPEWRTVVLTKSSCPMVDEDFFYERIGKTYAVCRDWREAVLTRLEEARPDVIVVGSASTYPFSEAQWVAGSARVLRRLSGSAQAVLLVPGTPSLGFNGPGCIARQLSPELTLPAEACAGTADTARTETVARHLEESAAGFPNVRVLDLNDVACPGMACRALSPDGLVVFRDNQHLTDSFVKARIPAIRARIESLLAPEAGLRLATRDAR